MPSISNYRGIVPAISCPFTEDHRIDEPALRQLASWLAGHEGQGAMFREAEVKARQPLGDLELIGTIDRIDGVSSTGEPTVLVIDYKTESDSVTRQRIKSGAEDTQLPFYAALLHHDTLRATWY